MVDPRPVLSGRSGGSPARSLLHLAEVTLDCCIVICRHCESLPSKLMPQITFELLMFVQLSYQDIILGRSCQGHDSIGQKRALCCSTGQVYSSNVDLATCSLQVRC